MQDLPIRRLCAATGVLVLAGTMGGCGGSDSVIALGSRSLASSTAVDSPASANAGTTGTAAVPGEPQNGKDANGKDNPPASTPAAAGSVKAGSPGT